MFKTILAVLLVVLAIVFHDRFYLFYKSFVDVTKSNIVGVFSDKQLAQYNGIDQDRLFLAFIGSVFDVTEGKKHYEKGAPYHYFIGKDGSRAFSTGNFNDESKDKDHVLDLSCDEMFALLQWRDTLKDKYRSVGVLIGRYYDDSGRETAYYKQLVLKVEQCRIEKDVAKQTDLKYPPCNMAWSVDDGSRVWCTKTSGGVSRSWVGVPRQLFTPGEKKPRCACVNLDKDNTLALLKEYKNCPATATSCELEA